jgi:hypothetical protein
MVYSNRRCIDFDSLKQFAPVIHGNRKGQGRIAMGKTSAGQSCSSDKEISTQNRYSTEAFPFDYLSPVCELVTYRQRESAVCWEL